MIWKMSPLFKFETQGVFVNTLAVITSILLGIVRICSSLFKSNYLKNEKPFLSFFFLLWNLHQILKTFGKEVIVIANMFSRLQTVKDLGRTLSQKRRFRTSFNSQYVKGSQTLVKSAWGNFYHISWSHWEGKTCKISPIIKFEILVVLVNTLSADENYPFGSSGNLQFQMQLS